MRALIIPTEGDPRAVDTNLTLDYLQGVVSSGLGGRHYIEAVNTHHGPSCTIFVNEEGKFNGCEFNKLATWFAVRGLAIDPRDRIMGDVIVVGPPGPDGEETPCPEATVEFVLRIWSRVRALYL